MKSKCLYEVVRKNIQPIDNNSLKNEDNDSNPNLIDPGFVANELTIITNYLTKFKPEKLDVLAEKLSYIDWENISNRNIFHQSLLELRNNLADFSKDIKKRSFHLLGHAHLDMAWLWETKETYQVAKRTFNSVLNLQKDFPNLTFGHSTACLYEWLENHAHSLFLEIQEAVKKGNWEILGGMWVEPEVNLISGESLVRQLLYGQKYFQSKFGNVTRVAWLPDSFGFPWQLPQILQQAEIEYFVTGKLHWNDTTKFPYPCFWWQSPDRSKIFTLMSPPNVTGVMDTNPITMTNYAVDWEKQTGLPDIFWLPGVGDHGGGPTRDMLDVAEVYSSSPFFPHLEFTTATAYLDKIFSSSSQIPTWNDELYLELHRGCYTTHADQKYFNRYSETLLYQGELFATLATLLANKTSRRSTDFPIIKNNNRIRDNCQGHLAKNQQKIEQIWKQVLFNQFHDILPGTSIAEVFVEANQNWRDAITKGEEILRSSLKAIASYICLPKSPSPQAKPLIIFNALNWKRTEIVEFSCPDGYGQIYDYNGREVITQITGENTLLFLAENIPSIGYKLFWLLPHQKETQTSLINGDNFVLENQYVRITIDRKTGDIKTLWDKINHQEIFDGLGNQLQFFQDEGQYWDAWNIDPNYQQYPLKSAELKSIQWLEKGEIQSTIRVIKIFHNSQFIQDYTLAFNSPILKIKNTVNWQENHVLVKAAFPLTINSDYVTYEIACGAIQRKTKPETEAEKAKWEVYGLKWADLSSENYGISLLNNCQNGYDSSPNQLRFSLLRSPTWPNPKADRGLHYFTYAIYPHRGDWKSAKTVHKSYELNIPLQVLILEEDNDNSEKILSPVTQLLDLGAENLILMALKLSEDHDNDVILRCYECLGKEAELNLENSLDLKITEAVNLLENLAEKQPTLTEKKLLIAQWKIVSFKLSQSISNS
jgi:alpha-mannosidase